MKIQDETPQVQVGQPCQFLPGDREGEKFAAMVTEVNGDGTVALVVFENAQGTTSISSYGAVPWCWTVEDMGRNHGCDRAVGFVSRVVVDIAKHSLVGQTNQQLVEHLIAINQRLMDNTLG